MQPKKDAARQVLPSALVARDVLQMFQRIRPELAPVFFICATAGLKFYKESICIVSKEFHVAGLLQCEWLGSRA
ncbi:MAG: hypothetical protein CMK72_09835 [Pseudomonadaceae bacterium]|nr:hypothetical protein [Pseudomonadaceae bacterium]HCP56930.1 hypothetical protein [Pseudomonas sp.]|tara:strand:+ start:494 stop:715 length:222 start_codon:yes stop_codon:yes gene_type:complete